MILKAENMWEQIIMFAFEGSSFQLLMKSKSREVAEGMILLSWK